MNEVEFFEEGEQYYNCFLQKIISAKRIIHLQTYIFAPDNFGTRVSEELIQAALRGVKVYLLVDAVGSKDLEIEFEQKLQDAGVFFIRFNEIDPKKWIGAWSRRLHHKILLTDGEAFIGGINVTSETYENKSVQPHLDFAVLLKGPAVISLTEYCQVIFRQAYHKPVKFDNSLFETQSLLKGIKTKISVNDWVLWNSQITKQYSHMVTTAKNDIVIINSYFFPRKKFMKQLVKAAKRGVRVRLVLPKYSDWPSYILATQYLYTYFLKNGVEIYQWNKSILHGKLATVDDVSTTIGSFNLNYTGYQQNLEMNVDLFSEEFTQSLNKKIDNWIVSSCEKIDQDEYLNKTPIRKKMAQFFFYIILSLVANFSIALTFRPKRFIGQNNFRQ